MEILERDFSNYHLGDNVYELADHLIPEIADRFDFELGDTASVATLGGLVGLIGKNKVLRNNEEVQAIGLNEAADFVERSGVQKPMARSLWTPEHGIPQNLNATVLTGAVANWQDRATRLVAGQSRGGKVYVATGSRLMNSSSELANANVQAFQAKKDKLPSESEYAGEFVVPALSSAGHDVEQSVYETESGDEIAIAFIGEHPELFGGDATVAFARVANAGIQLAIQFRQAAKSTGLNFDSRSNNPQAFVLTDTFPIARTTEEVAMPSDFQSPFTALRQVALTAKLLHETSQTR